MRRRAAIAVLAMLAVDCRRPAKRATIDEAAQPLLDAWADAVGGRAKLANLPYHSRVDGTEVWISATGQIRRVTEADGLRETRMFDGARGWLIDRDGETRELGPTELDPLCFDSFVFGGAALFPDRAVGTITLGAPDAIDIAMRTRNARIWFDQVSHLPSGIGDREMPRSATIGLGDWRAVDGVRVAFERRSQDGSQVEPFDVVDHEQAPPGAFVPPTEHPHDVHLAHALPVTVPMLISVEHLGYVTTDVNGVAVLLLVDSGTGDVVVDRDTILARGLTPFGETTADGSLGKLHGGYVRGVTFGLGGVSFAPVVTDATSLATLAPKFSLGLVGMLGYSFLSRFVVDLDYRAATMTLRDPDTYVHAGPTAAIPITLDQGVPHVEASVVGRDGDVMVGHFIVDTGCECLFDPNTPFAAAHPQVREATAIRLGATTITVSRVSRAGSSGPAHARRDFDGSLGAFVGDAFRIVLDYRHQRIWLDPY